MTQITQLSGDASYNGVNLLGGNNLTIDFNPTGTSSLTISGVNYNAAGLGLSTSAARVPGPSRTTSHSTRRRDRHQQRDRHGADPDRDVRHQFGRHRHPPVVRDRDDQYVADGRQQLVVADQNQESADLLTEQTQQQLEISALSIANQANQSVLKLFG